MEFIFIEGVKVRNGLEDLTGALERGEHLYTADTVHRICFIKDDRYRIDRFPRGNGFLDFEYLVF